MTDPDIWPSYFYSTEQAAEEDKDRTPPQDFLMHSVSAPGKFHLPTRKTSPVRKVSPRAAWAAMMKTVTSTSLPPPASAGNGSLSVASGHPPTPSKINALHRHRPRPSLSPMNSSGHTSQACSWLLFENDYLAPTVTTPVGKAGPK